MDLAHAAGARQMREYLVVHATAGENLETGAGPGSILGQPPASTHRVTTAAIGQDAIDRRHAHELVHGVYRIVQLIERAVERNAQLRCSVQHAADIVEGELPVIGEADDDPVDAEAMELGGGRT